MPGKRKCGTKDTVMGLAVMFGCIAFVFICAAQGWEPGFVVRAALALPPVAVLVLAPIAFILWIVSVVIGRRG